MRVCCCLVRLPWRRSRSKLEELKVKEAGRAREFQSLVTEYATEGVHGLEAAGPLIRTRLVQLVRRRACTFPALTYNLQAWRVLLKVTILVRLLDNFLMPDDLPPIREDGSDEWVYALPGRKDDKQLFRLAAANAEAEGEFQQRPGLPARQHLSSSVLRCNRCGSRACCTPH
jgi:hypothetical protein